MVFDVVDALFVDFDGALFDHAAGVGFGGGEAGFEDEVDKFVVFGGHFFRFDVFGEAAFLEDGSEVGFGLVGFFAVVVDGDEFAGEAHFEVFGVFSLFERFGNFGDFFFVDVRGESEVVDDEVVGNGHCFAVDVFGGFVDADVVAGGFAHFFAAVGADEEWDGDDVLGGLVVGFLDDAASEEVEGLVGAAKFDIGAHGDGVVALH